MTDRRGDAASLINKGLSICIVIICSGIFISFVWNNNVWMDEAFTASLVNTDYPGVLYRSMADTLPPLYNLYLKTMTVIFGYTIPVMKISSVIPMILTLILGMTTVRKRFGQKVAVLFCLAITFMPLMLYFGVEIRMYSLGFFFATASGVYAYELVCDFSKKNMCLFVLFSALAGYSHHFAFVTVGFVFGYLLLYYLIFDKKNIRRWFIALGFTFLLYLPCLLITLKQIKNVSGYFSMPDVDLHLFIQYALYPYMVGKLPGTVVCALIVCAALAFFVIGFIRKSGRDREKIYAFLCFTVYYGVLLFGTVVSKIMTANIFVDRYLFFSTGLLWLFAAIVLGKADKRIYIVSLLAFIFVGVCSYIVEYGVEYGNSADEEISVLRENVKEGDVFLGLGGHEELENCIPFYSMADKDTPELGVVYSLGEGLAYLDQNPGSTLFVGVMPDYEFSSQDEEMLNFANGKIEKISEFEFDRYVCDFYAIKME